MRVGSRCGASGFVSVSGFAVRVGSSGFVGASGFVGVCRHEWVRRASSVRVGSRCDDLSTLFVSLFARGPEMAK